MAAVIIKVLIVSLFVTSLHCNKGHVTDVLINRRFSCPRASKEIHKIESEIQCTHRCLRKRCKVLNYNAKEENRENCEIITGECSSKSNEENWKAVTLQVNTFGPVIYDVTFEEDLS